MRYLITLFIAIFLSGCSISVTTVDMSTEPTTQEFDLTDADNDGVILARDMCAASFKGAKVNNTGCGMEKVEKIRRKLLVNFDSNSYLIKRKFYSEIKSLADFMKDYPDTKVTIEGHTSKLGSRQLNTKLSQNRAQAVKDLLINRFSIDKARVNAIGYGFDKLLLEGNDKYIHARNRRIVAEISSEKSLTDMKWTIYSVDERLE